MILATAQQYLPVLKKLVKAGADLDLQNEVTTIAATITSRALHLKVAVQACDYETTRHTKAYLIQTRSTDGNKLYIKQNLSICSFCLWP